MENKDYHVVFKETNESEFTKGITYEAANEMAAIMIWRTEYPKAIFVYLSSQEVLHKEYVSLGN